VNFVILIVAIYTKQTKGDALTEQEHIVSVPCYISHMLSHLDATNIKRGVG
jgi:hypothetical protein